MRYKKIKILLGLTSCITFLTLPFFVTQCDDNGGGNHPTNDNFNFSGTNWQGYSSGTLTITIDSPATATTDGSCYIVSNSSYVAHNLHIPAYVFDNNNLKYKLSYINNSCFLSCTGLTGSLTLPSSLTNIKENTFKDCTGLTGSLSIPDNVTVISSYAFAGCTGFTNLSLNSHLTTIGTYAFNGCTGFTGNLNIPNSITSILNRAFQSCIGFNGILSIPTSLTNVGSYAFQSCSNFNNITFNNWTSAPTWGSSSAFAGWSSLQGSVSCSSGSEVFTNKDACEYLKTYCSLPHNWTPWKNDKKIDGSNWVGRNGGTLTLDLQQPQNVAALGSATITCSYNYSTVGLIIPEIVCDGYYSYQIVGIASSCFLNDAQLTGSISFPSTISSIGQSAFDGCVGLTGELNLPAISSIESWTFEGCSNLTSINIPDTVTSIGTSSFQSCIGLSSISIKNTVTTVGIGAFSSCTNISVINLDGWSDLTPGSSWCEGVFTDVSAYGEVTCTSTELSALSAAEWLKSSMGLPPYWTPVSSNYALDGSNWPGHSSGTLDVTTIGPKEDETFGTAVITSSNNYIASSLIIPDIIYDGDTGYIVTDISSRAFLDDTNLNGTLSLGGGVKTIDEGAFKGCTNLISVDIPSSVTSIGENAFFGCTALTSMNILGNGSEITSIGKDAFKDCTQLVSTGGAVGKIYMSSITNIYYLRATNSIYYCLGSAYRIATDGSNSILSSYFQVGTTIIADDAFNTCTINTAGGLQQNNSLITIGDRAFKDCSGVTGIIDFTSSVSCIGEDAFNGCSNIEGVVLYDWDTKLKTLSSEAFANCSKLSSITLDGFLSAEIPESSNWGTNIFSGVSADGAVNIRNAKDVDPGKLTYNLAKVLKDDYALPSAWSPNYDPAQHPDIYGTNWVGYGGSGSVTMILTDPTTSGSVEGTAVISSNNNYVASSLVIPDYVTNGTYKYNVVGINSSAFSGCSGLTGGLTFSAHVASLGAHAFDGCTNLSGALTLSLNDDNTQVPDYCFNGCNFTNNLTLDKSINSIGEHAFSGNKFTQLIFFNGAEGQSTETHIDTIGDYAFSDCTSLGNSTVFVNATTIGKHAFEGATIGTTNICSTVVTIDEYAFQSSLMPLGGLYFNMDRPTPSGGGDKLDPTPTQDPLDIKNGAFNNCQCNILTFYLLKDIPNWTGNNTTFNLSSWAGVTGQVKFIGGNASAGTFAKLQSQWGLPNTWISQQTN